MAAPRAESGPASEADDRRAPISRSVIDYALARRALLAEVYAGRTGTTEVCDAHPYLLRAAKHHGEPSDTRCPICRDREPLTHVTYVYGDGLGEASGRARRRPDLDSLARAHGELHVYVVEVCSSCSWNHLVVSSVVGQGTRGAGRGRSRSPRQ